MASSSMASGLDPSYVALVGLSDAFLRSSPPNVASCVRCLQAALKLASVATEPRLEARTHLQIATLLHKHTDNHALAKHHVEQAVLWYRCEKRLDVDEGVRFETVCLLSQLYAAQNHTNVAKQTLASALDLARANPYWHCRILFLLASLHAGDKDYVSAVAVLSAGAEFAALSGAFYTRALFLLTKAMLLLLERKFAEANTVLHETGPLIENWVLQNTHQKQAVAKHQKEYLQIFFLVLQVCYFLMLGQVKSVKLVLKQLQQCIQTVTSQGWPRDDEVLSVHPADNFEWLTKDHLCILVYLVTVMHSMQAGYMDKAQKYTDKAILQIEKLKTIEPVSILYTFHVLLLEHIIQCRLVTGNKALAIQEVGQLCAVLQTKPILMHNHRPQLHTLLGLYAMSMNQMEWAETQFNTALRTSTERELWTFANLSLAIVYLRQRRDSDFMALVERISPERLSAQTHSHSLMAASFYVHGLHAFFGVKYNDCKRFLRETLKMANAEDLNRLTSCSLVLLGHIFLSLNNTKEAMNMVTPAMQLASKIPDVHVQLWASAILKDLHSVTGDEAREQEGLSMHTSFSQTLLKDHFHASQLPQHRLIEWTDGNFPCVLQTEVGSSHVSASSTEQHQGQQQF